MKAKSTACRATAALLALAGLVMGGCACCGPQRGCGPGNGGYLGFGPPICFGYSSTCWSAWPAECVQCPTFSYPPQVVEPPPDKTVPETQPELPAEPAPVPEPSPSDEKPATENKQSRHEPPPPVLTLDPLAESNAPHRELLLASEPSPAYHSETSLPASPASEDVAQQVLTAEESPATELRPASVAPQAVEAVPDISAPPAASPSRFVRKTRPLFPQLFGKPVSPPSAAAKTEQATSEPVQRAAAEFGPPPPVLIEPPSAAAVPSAPIQVTHYEASPAAKDAPQMIFNRAADSQHGPPPPVLIESPAAEPVHAPAAAPVAWPADVGQRQSHILADWSIAEPVIAPIVPGPRQLASPAVSSTALPSEQNLAPIVSPEAVRRGLAPVRTSD